MSTSAKVVLFVAWITIAGAMSSSCGRQGCDAGSRASQPDKGAERSGGGSASVAYSSVGDPNPWFTTFAGEISVCPHSRQENGRRFRGQINGGLAR